MVLTHAVDISVAYSTAQGSPIPPPQDVVLTVPSYATQQERRALLDAAELAELNVLTLIDETTAAGLQYAMDKKFDDGEQLLLFYNMGASALQVSLIRFFSYEQPQKYGKPKPTPALEVLAKAWDATLGGLAFDHLLVEYLADQFNHAWAKTGRGKDKDVRTIPRAMTKLRIQANKVKHVLSANTEIPVYMESVHDDVSLSTLITRTQLEELAAGLLERSVKPIEQVLKAADRKLEDLTGIELIGGGMRIPRVQTEISKAVNGMELGMHINADESMALGAAFAGANISTAFRVRPVGMTDIYPFPMQVTLSDLPSKDKKAKKGDEEWNKNAVVFQAFSKMGVKKTIAFTHDSDVHCSLDYVEDDLLPPGTNRAIERYEITGVAEFAEEMEKKELGKPKVSLQFELSSSGITSLVKAEAVVEETYTVEEEEEVDDEEAAAEAPEDAERKTEEAADSNETVEANATEPVKPKKKIMVQKVRCRFFDHGNGKKAIDAKVFYLTWCTNLKFFGKRLARPAFVPTKEKKKLHKRPLTVKAYHEGKVRPHSPELLEASKNKLLDMATRDKERMMLEESKNRVESYIYRIKNKLEDDEEVISKVTTKQQREEVRKLAVDAEEWLYDAGYDADFATMEDKYAELSTPFEKIMLRVSETTDRPEAVKALQKKLTEIEQLMAKWEQDRPQVTEEERTGVLDRIEGVRKWISDKEEEQKKKKPHEDPAFVSADVPSQTAEIEKTVLRLSRKPKPKPPKKNETKAENATEDASNSTAEGGATEGTGEGAPEEAADGEKKEGEGEKEDEL